MTGHQNIILQVIQDYAPDKDTRVKLYETAKMMPSKHRLINLIGILYDGLQYGNWPWTMVQLNKKEKQ